LAKKQLKIAYLIEDEFSGVTTGVKNTVKETVAYLESQGHILEEFPI